MHGWRLQIKRESGLSEVINLDAQKKIRVGDDTNNEICIASTAIPANLLLIQNARGELRLRLTDEVRSSLKGEFSKKKKWKDPLYQGEIYVIEGHAEWKIGENEFKVYQADRITLSPITSPKDPQERKHFWQSVGLSATTHLLLLLVLLVGGFILREYETKQEDLLAKAEKVSIAEVKEIFKPQEEIVAVQEEAPAVVEPEPVKPPEPKAEKPKPKAEKAPKPGAKKNKALAAATGKSSTPAKPNVKAMGLLAIQGAKTTEARSLSIDQPKVFQADPAAKTNGIGMNTLGSGVRSGIQTQQVAQLNGVSVGGYESGALSKQIGTKNTPAVQLVRKEIEIRGGLDPAVIQQIIEERLAEVRYCYENALLTDTNIGGKISTSWTIRADGSVSDLEAMSEDPKLQRIHGCIKERIVRWKFPEPKGGGVVHVKYPFVFSSLGS